MIWALKIDSCHYYTWIVKDSLYLTMACLDISSAGVSPVQVMMAFGSDETEYLLCTLDKFDVWQVPLNLNIEEGSITFTCNGKGCVHLTGYSKSNLLKKPESNLVGNTSYFIQKLSDEVKPIKNRVNRNWTVSSEEKTEEEREINSPKNKATKSMKPSTNFNDNNNDDNCDETIKNFEGDDDDDDNDSDNYVIVNDDNISTSLSLNYDNNEMNKDENDNDNEMDENENDNDKNKEMEQNEQEEFQKQGEDVKPQKKDELTEEEINGKQYKEVTKKEKQKKINVDKRILSGGVQMKKLKFGTGKVAKVGKHVTIYYLARVQLGCLKLRIDECLKGVGFTFKVGSGMVLRGLDVGIIGMKVGEKRRLIIPAKMGHGAKGFPPFIPPKSTLIYDIELLQVE